MEKIQVSGNLYLAGSSQYKQVNVHVSPEHITVVDKESGERLHNLPITEVKISSPLANVPREISFSNQDLLSVNSDKKLDVILDHKESRIHRMERSFSWVLGSIILTPLALIGIFKYAIPALAIVFAQYVPEPVTQLASRHTMIAMDRTLLAPSEVDAKRQQDYQQQWQSLIAMLDIKHKGYQIHFRKSDKMGANAFALPDGTIVITDGLIELVDNDVELLNAILLHEIGHVEHQHSMRLVAETLVSSMAINYFFGDIGGMIEFFVGMSTTVVQNQFSQKLEWQADNFALAQLEVLGKDKEHFAKAMEKLASQAPEESRIESLLSSHPSIKQRIENARQ